MAGGIGGQIWRGHRAGRLLLDGRGACGQVRGSGAQRVKAQRAGEAPHQLGGSGRTADVAEALVREVDSTPGGGAPTAGRRNRQKKLERKSPAPCFPHDDDGVDRFGRGRPQRTAPTKLWKMARGIEPAGARPDRRIELESALEVRRGANASSARRWKLRLDPRAGGVMAWPATCRRGRSGACRLPPVLGFRFMPAYCQANTAARNRRRGVVRGRTSRLRRKLVDHRRGSARRCDRRPGAVRTPVRFALGGCGKNSTTVVGRQIAEARSGGIEREPRSVLADQRARLRRRPDDQPALMNVSPSRVGDSPSSVAEPPGRRRGLSPVLLGR